MYLPQSPVFNETSLVDHILMIKAVNRRVRSQSRCVYDPGPIGPAKFFQEPITLCLLVLIVVFLRQYYPIVLVC